MDCINESIYYLLGMHNIRIFFAVPSTVDLILNIFLIPIHQLSRWKIELPIERMSHRHWFTKAKETLSVVPQLNDLSAALWYEMRLKGISFHCAPTWLWRRTTTSRRDRGCKNVTTFYEERAGEMVVAANNNKFRRQSTRTEQHNNMTINTLSVDRNVTSRATLTCRTTTTINTIEAKA